LKVFFGFYHLDDCFWNGLLEEGKESSQEESSVDEEAD